MTYSIEFGPKFTQAQMDDILARKESEHGSSYWELSFEKTYKTIIFDLTLTEWFSTEQIVFLFGWIRNVKATGKKAKVKVPLSSALNSIYPESELKRIAGKYKDQSGEYQDNDIRKGRRHQCCNFLLVVWGMLDEIGLKQAEDDFLNLEYFGHFNRQSRHLLANDHKIIPFAAFDLSFQRQNIKYDRYFQDLINNNLDSNFRTSPIFELQQDIQDLLKEYACYSPFESKILSNVITQELYINSLQHANKQDDTGGLLHECYMTASLRNKRKDPNRPLFLRSFIEEKYPETLDFYKDKKQIKRRIDALIKEKKYRLSASRKANLAAYNEDFLNRSYLEFSFLDFGIGIPTSLEAEFKRDLTENPARKDQLSPGFSSAGRDSQILEYAFLMDTSRSPLDEAISDYELVPRGLYFLADMVRRYKGLMIVRSGQGKVIFDFSDTIYIQKIDAGFHTIIKPVYKLAEAVQHVTGPLDFFPGCLFTIILPEKSGSPDQRDQSVLPPVRTEQSILSNYIYSLVDKNFSLDVYPKDMFAPSSFEYVSIIFLYNNVIESLRKQKVDIDVVNIYNRLFSALNDVIDSVQGKSCIIFFDFAGLRPGNPSWIKILYFLLNTPKINEQTKAIVVNLPADEGKMVRQLKEDLSGNDRLQRHKEGQSMHEPLLYRPIPCIRFSATASSVKELITWIGLKDSGDEDVLTDLLLNKDLESYSLDALTIPANAEGNLFLKNDGRLFSVFSGFDDIKKQFLDAQKEAIVKFLANYVESGVDPETGMVKHIYLASNGGYQYNYLSLYELLHDKNVSSYFAQCLLDQYCFSVEGFLMKKKKSHQDENTWPEEKKKLLQSYRFTKIIAVTVSSQLLGLSIRDLIDNDDTYSFLRITETKGVDRAPELIMLSNYYSFAKEKPFERIGPKDAVLIVNDVISTGRLVKEILTQIDEVKRVPFTGVFSIVDSRIDHWERIDDNEMDSYFFPDYESRFVTLCHFDDAIYDKRIILRKYNPPYQGDAVRKRINPLLNTVVELKAAHSEQQKILIPDLQQIVDLEFIHDEYFKIGHFQQNLSHNSYITNMRALFGKQDGILLIKQLNYLIGKKRLSTGKANDDLAIQLTDLLSKAEAVQCETSTYNLKEEMADIAQKIARIKDRLLQDNFQIEGGLTFQPDFIFYPHISGIEKANHISLSKIFGTHPDHIIGLQRFDTPKGWRFPFPARRYNEFTRNKDVLILDSGSLTGDTLVQLIDNIAFLDVRSITVLVIITRVDDFHREFYSRLRSIKVKRLRRRAPLGAVDSHAEEDHVIPLEIVFGICLNIPVFASSVSCPFCEELKMYEGMLAAKTPAPTQQVIKYIELRQNELRCFRSALEILDNISYIPTRRQDGQVDTKRIFRARDLLGKIDSYRFFPEYFEWAENLEKQLRENPDWVRDPMIKRELEGILICILHEPMLYYVINNAVHGLLSYLHAYLQHALFEVDDFDKELFYQWKLYPLTKLVLTLSPQTLYSVENFEQLLRYNDNNTKLYLHYYCWNILYHPIKFAKENLQIDAMLRSFGGNFQKKKNSRSPIYKSPNEDFFKLATHRYNLERIEEYKYLDQHFNYLSQYALKRFYLDRHLYVKRLLNLVYSSISSTEPSLVKIQERMRAALNELRNYIRPSVEKIALDPNLEDYAEPIYRYFGRGPDGVLYNIDDLEELYGRIGNRKPWELNKVTSELTKIKNRCASMVSRTFQISEESQSFYEVCNQFPCDIKEIFKEIKDHCRELNIQHDIIWDDTSERILIGHHKWLFTEMLKELIENAERIYRETNTPGQASLHVYFRYEIMATEPGTISVFFSQNFPFQSSNRLGGLEKLVKHYTLKFAGEFSDNRDAADEDYTIILKFKLFGYEDSPSEEKLSHSGKI